METTRVKIIAIIAAIVTAAVAFYYIHGVEASKPTETTVVEAIERIPSGTQITADMLQEAKVYTADLIPNSATSSEELVGMYASADINAGEQIPTSRVANQSASSSAKSFSYKIPKGMRTVTISIDPTTSVAGMLQVGDHVDILATYTKETGNGADGSSDSQVVTKYIADNIEIAALDQTVVRDDSSDNSSNVSSSSSSDGTSTFTNVTMFVKPDLAKAIVWENQNGSLVLSLRSPDEKDNPDHDEFTAASINDF